MMMTESSQEMYCFLITIQDNRTWLTSNKTQKMHKYQTYLKTSKYQTGYDSLLCGNRLSFDNNSFLYT